MKYYDRQVVFQEVPNEISLAYSITGCDLQCKGCHSAFTWDGTMGTELTVIGLVNDLEKYGSLVSCVLFYGGEWHEDQLIQLLSVARRNYNLKTCLYTGRETVSDKILTHLTFVKTGRWIEELGGLDSPTTNQVLRIAHSGEILNHYFINNNTKRSKTEDDTVEQNTTREENQVHTRLSGIG